MNTMIPEYLFSLTLPARSAILLSVIAGFWFAARRSQLERVEQFRIWLIVSAALLGWFAAASLLGELNFFLAARETPPLVPFAVGLPIVIGLIWFVSSPRLRAAAAGAPQSWLVGVQVYRVVGVIFVVLWSQGHLPGEFALPAGLGDVAVGVLAPVVAWMAAVRAPSSRLAVWAWNVFGLADLVVAVGTGFLTSPSAYQLLALDRPNLLISAWPLVMVPAFLVPLSVLLHAVSLWKLRQSETTDSAPALRARLA